MEKAVMILFPLLVLGLLGLVTSLNETNIIGGQEASPGEFPYVVSIMDTRYGTCRHFCGGFIYSSTSVVTSAQCLNSLGVSDIEVRAGEYDRSKDEGTEQTVYVSKITIHPDFDDKTMENDIAVLNLESKLNFGNYVNNIALSGVAAALPADLTLMGWGSTSDKGDAVNILHKVSLPTWKEHECRDALQSYPFTVSNTNICAGAEGLDGCYSDEGGPLVSENEEVFGIASWSIGCGKAGQPGVYTKASHYAIWIAEISK